MLLSHCWPPQGIPSCPYLHPNGALSSHWMCVSSHILGQLGRGSEGGQAPASL